MRILAVIFIMITLLLSFGCTSQTGEIKANLGQEVELKIGKTVYIEDEQIKVKFIEVTNDSR